ncbi:MAG: orotidine-5'-phosphate decarboxylase, partial [Planctomycetota bacterium]
GVAAFERLTAASKHAGMLVLADVKRGDIGSTAAAYAEAFLTGPGGGSSAAEMSHLADAATVNPYLGSDSIQPFLDACQAAGAGIYVLVRTSNPSSSEFQTLEVDRSDESLSDRVADTVARWGKSVMGTTGWSSIGAVTGATHREELRALRERMPQTPLLLPGYGAQGAGADDVQHAFTDGLHGALVNSSRGILYAYRQWPELHWKDAAARAIDEMGQALRSALLPG